MYSKNLLYISWTQNLINIPYAEILSTYENLIKISGNVISWIF